MKKLCRFAVCLLILCVGIGTLSASLWAVTSIHGDWNILDYWLAWFSGISFILGFGMILIGGVAAGTFLSDLCGGP